MRWLDGIINSMDMNLGKIQEMVRNREAWHAVLHAVTVGPDLVSKQQQICISEVVDMNNNKSAYVMLLIFSWQS